jgi:hypothetical protein
VTPSSISTVTRMSECEHMSRIKDTAWIRKETIRFLVQPAALKINKGC